MLNMLEKNSLKKKKFIGKKKLRQKVKNKKYFQQFPNT